MARGGFRPGAGRMKGSTAMSREDKARIFESKSPLEYMLSVMNDPQADANRRDRMAVAAAPYVHERASDNQRGKKEERQEAADRAASGKYAVPEGPRLN